MQPELRMAQSATVSCSPAMLPGWYKTSPMAWMAAVAEYVNADAKAPATSHGERRISTANTSKM